VYGEADASERWWDNCGETHDQYTGTHANKQTGAAFSSTPNRCIPNDFNVDRSGMVEETLKKH
jgi:hypothetical protein